MLRVVGELDLATVSVLRDAFDSVPLTEHRVVVLDVRDVEFMSAAGLRVVMQARERLDGAGVRLVLRSPRPLFRRVLEIADGDGRFTVEGIDGDEQPLGGRLS